ncbi:unnamed protein product, partial [Onchocerca ochengi]|uniref:Uncharacterized protein n=1 Tax=Onchocerca ochengi TaxID=42157 RepID=A0A182F0D9_ONCOC
MTRIGSLGQESSKEVRMPTLPTSYAEVHLPQLSLPIFCGDPRKWRNFGAALIL